MPKFSDEELINHYGAVRMRVVGSGNLRMKLLSLDEVKSVTLVPFIMEDPAWKEPTRLANFTQQRAQLEISTTNINDYFTISKIVIFVKPTATSYPE